MKTKTQGMLAAAIAVACASAASAGTITQSGSLSQATTNWSRTFQVDQFDTLGGARVLEQVVIEMNANLDGSARFENRDGQSRTVQITMNSSLTISLGAQELLAATPGMGGSYSVGAFDGAIDFAGLSGRTIQALTSMESASMTYSEPGDDLDAWVGGGQVTLTAAATAVSFASGGGNLLAMFQTTAGVDYVITYVFRGEVVPTPTAAGLGLAGLFGVAGIRRRRS